MARTGSGSAEKNSIFGTMNIAQVLGYVLPTLFLVLGDQNMIQRFSSAKDSRTARKSNVGLVIAEVVVCALIIGLVTCAIPLYPTNDSADTILFQLAAQKLPTVLGGIVMAACMSFVITTGDSYLLSTASNLTYDVWVRLIKKDADDKQKLNMLRISIVLVAFLAFVLGFYFPDILSVQMYAYTMYGATITPALICALFYKKSNQGRRSGRHHHRSGDDDHLGCGLTFSGRRPECDHLRAPGFYSNLPCKRHNAEWRKDSSGRGI